MPSSRAAILTPSPIKSPSLSSTTSPRWMPIRNSMRRSVGRPVFRSTMPLCTSIAHRIDHTAELDDAAVPGALNDAAVMGGDGRIDEIATESPEACERTLLVHPGKSTVTDNVRDKYRRKFPGLGHLALRPSNLT